MLNFFKTYINSKNYSILMFLCVIMGLIEVYTATMVPLEIKNLIDSISKGSNLSVFFSYSMKIIAFVSIGSLISILTNAYTKKHTLDVSDSVRSVLIEKILGSKYENYLSLNTNDVYSSISSKLDSLVNFFTSEIRVLFISILTIVSSLIFMIIIDYKMMLLIMFIIVSFSFTLFFLSRRNAALEKISDLEKDKFLSVMRNILEEVDIIKCCGSHHIVMRKLSEILIRYKNIRNKIIVRNSISEPLSSFFVSISILSVMSLGAYQVHRNYITSGDLIAFIVFVFNLSVPLMRIVSFSKNYNTSIVNLISVGKITDLPEELQKGTTCVPHTGDGLSFRDVKFEYKSNRDRNLFIKSAEIPNNSFVLIKGESGNGKTTFLNILNMLLHPKSGDITYNGIPISDINTKSWRKIIGYVPQNPKLLRGTIEDNIRFGIGDLDLDKTIDIAEALKIAKCDNFVSEFNQKSSSRVIVDGETFSGGEIQRIAIARAIIRDPRILILDEPTAHLDEDNRNAVISAIISSSKERTVLIVSHDMEIEEFVTHIASVKNGEVYIKRRDENNK